MNSIFDSTYHSSPKWMIWPLRITVSILIVASFLPLFAVDAWWIRWFDFPRLQISMLLIFFAIVTLFLRFRYRWFWIFAIILTLGFQAAKLLPYSSLMPTQAAQADRCLDENIISLMSINVLKTNLQYDLLIDQVNSFHPDILLVLEPDKAWIRGLAELENSYSYVKRVPLDNYYGMAY